jgi:hypothetical protein
MPEMAEASIEANILLRLLTERPRWILAQRAELSWVSATHLTRKTQVDFSFRDIAGLVGDKAYVYLPVADIDKHLSPQMFSVFDQTGKRLPTMTRTQSMQHAALALLASQPEVRPSEELIALVSALSLSEPETSQMYLERIAELPDSPIGWEDPLARLLVSTYPLLVEVPTNDTSHRSISFEVTDTMKKLRRPISAVPRTLGWTSWSIWIATSALGSEGSSEFVVRAPNGAFLSSAILLIPDWDRKMTERKSEVNGFTGPGRISAIRLSPKHVSTGARVMLGVNLVPDRSYTLGVLATAALVAAVLTIGLGHLESVQTASDAAATILLAGPGLLSTLVAQPGRGSLVAQFVVGARAILISSALLAYLAAGALVALDSISDVESVWLVLTGLTWINVALLVPAVINPGSVWRARKVKRMTNHQAEIQVTLE